jgi:type II secretory ATPase GspE/PulE/Tfp pilus assembly ATPase PilB-like protein
MKTLQESALEWVYQGVTSLSEVVRVTHEEDFSQKEEKR